MSISNSLPVTTLLTGTSNLGASKNSIAYNISSTLGYSIQMTTANDSSLNVSAALAISIDGVNFFPVTSTAQTFTTSTTYVWNMPNTYYNWVEVQITRTGGNSDCTIVATTKE